MGGLLDDVVANGAECAVEDRRGDGTFLDGCERVAQDRIESDLDIDDGFPARLIEADLEPVGIGDRIVARLFGGCLKVGRDFGAVVVLLWRGDRGQDGRYV